MKSKTVKMISSVAVLVVLSGTYVGVKSYVASQEEKEAAEADQSVSVLDLEEDDIASVAFRSEEGDDVVFKKEDDSWIKKDEEEFPLNQDSVTSAVSGISQMTADQELEQTEELSEYDLDEPENEIIITMDDGEETVIQVGMKNDSTDQYYIKKSDDDKNIYLVPASSIDPFMSTVYDFADADTFPSVTSSTITDVKVEKEDGYELSQDSATLSWNVSDGKDSEKADTTKAGTVTSAIGSLMYGDFVDYNCTDDEEYGFDDPYAVITVEYTEEEEVPEDTSSEEEDSGESAENTDSQEETDGDDETETITVDKELVIYVGDQTGTSRYVKVNDSSQVYTISEDSLSDITDSTVEDFYNLTVSYLSVNNLDSLKIEAEDGSHDVEIIRETAEDEDGEETTSYSYKLDGEDIEETDFTTFYNKLINMAGQERLTESYEPEGTAYYTFTFTDTEGTQMVVKYYEYDTNFYAAVVDDKVYLVNKMNVKDLEAAYEEMTTAKDTSEDTEEEVSEE